MNNAAASTAVYEHKEDTQGELTNISTLILLTPLLH